MSRETILEFHGQKCTVQATSLENGGWSSGPLPLAGLGGPAVCPGWRSRSVMKAGKVTLRMGNSTLCCRPVPPRLKVRGHQEDTFEKEAKDYRNGRRRPRVDSAHLPRANLPPSVSRMANTANMHPPVWNLLSDPAPPLQAIVLTYRTGMARPHCPSPHALLGSLSEPSELQT